MQLLQVKKKKCGYSLGGMKQITFALPLTMATAYWKGVTSILIWMYFLLFHQRNKKKWEQK